MLDRNHLMILNELERAGTITEAASRLNLTQSALSHTIRKLESQFDVRIWDRAGRKLKLTEAGEHLLDLSKRLLPQFESTEQWLNDYSSGLAGFIRIGMECHPCYQWLLGVVSPFFKQWPKIDVDIIQKFQFGGLHALKNHEIDLLITPDPLQSEGIRYEKVFDYELVLAVSSEHSLAKFKFIESHQLTNETLLTYPVKKDRLDIFTQFLLPDYIDVKKHKTIENTDIMMQMVSAQRGVTALPMWLIKRYQKSDDISYVRLGENGIQKNLSIGMRENDYEKPSIKGFLNIATDINIVD
jgi:LysR family transcriptional regulator for metE and metH